MSSFGETLKKLRLERGLSIFHISNALGMSVAYLSDVERGARNPLSVDKIKVVADLLGIDPTDLIIRAGVDKGCFRFPLRNLTEAGMQFCILFMQLQESLTDKDFQALLAVIAKKKPKSTS